MIETRIIIYLFTVNRISNGLGFNNECLFIFLLSIIVFKYTHICFFLSCRILSSNTSGAVGGLAYTLNYNGHIKRVRIACFQKIYTFVDWREDQRKCSVYVNIFVYN